MAADTPQTLISVEIAAGKNGTETIPGDFLLMSVHIVKDINKIPQATITFADGGVAEFEKFKVAESKLFDRGNKVVVKAGYNHKVETVFEGYVFDQDLQLGKVNKFVVKCYNQAKFLTLVSMSDEMTEKKPIEAVEFVLKNNGNKAKVKASLKNKGKSKAATKERIVLDPQVNCWDYIKQNLANFIAIPHDDELVIDVPDFSKVDSSVKVLYGTNLLSFKVKEEPNVLRTLQISGYDEKKPDEELLFEKGPDVLYKSFKSYFNADTDKLFSANKMPEIISGTHIHTKADIDHIVETRKSQNLLAFKSGSITITGDSGVKLASLIKVEGLPGTYSENYFVGGIEHKIDKDWVTTIKVGANASGGLGKLGGGGGGGAGGAGASGGGGSTGSGGTTTGAVASGNLTIAVVKEIHTDKNGLYKVKIIVPKLGKKLVDARLLMPYAGNNDKKEGEGMFFFPNVESEVIATPLEGDVNHWLIVGSLYSTKNKPGEDLAPDEKNLHKAIVTKHFFLDFFDDDAKAKLLITDRKDKKYQISMDIVDKPNINIKFDKTFIKLDDEHGIMVDSAKNITLKAKEEILLDANKITVKAKTDIAMEGQNIKGAAKVAYNVEGAQIAVKGKSQVNVESSAMAAFKGSAMTNIG